jgi:hypothetical protein
MISRKNKLEEQKTVTDEHEFSVTVSVKIGGKVIEQDIEESLHIPSCDRLTLPVVMQIMSENPSLHARWNILYNEAVYEYDVLKTKFEVWYSKKSQEYRKELEKFSKGRVTDKMVEDIIRSDAEYETINDELALAKKNMKHIFVLANGFGEKGEKIISIASLLKWESENLSGKKQMENKQYSHIERGYEKKEVEKEVFDINKNDGWPT